MMSDQTIKTVIAAQPGYSIVYYMPPDHRPDGLLYEPVIAWEIAGSDNVNVRPP